MSETSRFWPVSRAIAKALTIPGTSIGPGILVDIQDKLDDEQDKRDFIAAIGDVKNHQQEIRDLLKGEFSVDALQNIEDTIPAVAESFYRREVASEFMFLDFKGIHQTQKSFDIRLDDVFVDLAVQRLPQSTFGAANDEEAPRERLESANERDSELIEDEIVQKDHERLEATKLGAEKPEKLDIESMLREPGGVVVLGDPGSGKTTLIKRLARQAALGPDRDPTVLPSLPQLFPVVIPITAYDEGGAGQSLFDFIRDSLRERFGEGVDRVFMDHWVAGQCLFLLDGLDEVANTRQRIAVARRVETFVREIGENRVVVTSRPYGYSICRLSSPRDHVTVLPFSPQDMERFANNWYRAFEEVNHSEAPQYANAERDAKSLVAEIRANEQVESLATNPFMLTIIAVVKRQNLRLPDHRVKVYELATNTMIETWHHARHLHIQEASGHDEMASEDFRAVVEELAYWMHATKSTGTYQKNELQSRLRDLLMGQGLNKNEAIKQAGEYLRIATERAGLLLPRGQNHLAFMHQTFQEYLAAQHIVNRGSDDEAIQSLLGVCLDSRWHEVVRLAAGIFGVINRSSPRASKLLEALMADHKDPLEPILGRRLLLAASCLADDVRVHPSVSDRVIQVLLQRCDDLDSVGTALRKMQKTRPGPEAIEALLRGAKHSLWIIRMESIRMLARVADSDPRIEPFLQSRLSDEDLDVRSHAAWGLWVRGHREGNLSKLIMQGINSDYAYMPTTYSEELFAMVSRLLGDEDVNVRLSAVHTMGTWDHQADSLPVLMRLLEDEDANVRLKAARTLGDWDHQADALPVLTRLLDDKDMNVCLSAIQMLGDWDHQADALPVLTRLLEDEDAIVRLKAARTLGTWDHQADALPVLTRLLEDEDANVRLSAIHTLGDRDHQADALPVLMRLLEDEDWIVRIQAVHILGGWDHQADVLPALTRLLEDKDMNVRLSAIHMLGDRDHQAEALPVLTRLLEDEDAHVRFNAARTLGEWDHQADALPALTRLLEDEDADVRLQAARTLALWERNTDSPNSFG